MCADLAPFGDDPVSIACTDLLGNSLAVSTSSDSVSPISLSAGEEFSVATIGDAELPPRINCTIGESDGTVIQWNVIDVSGDVSLDLKDTFGSLQLES